MLQQRSKWAFRILKLLIVVAVVVGIGHFVTKAWLELQEKPFPLANLSPWWLFLSGVFYLVGMLPAGLFWHRLLLAMGQHPTRWDTLGAYYVGHLGKYVPGKVMVVVLRSGLIRSDRVDTASAAVTVFMETLTQMTVGAGIAGMIIAVRYSHHRLLLLLALLLMIAAGLPTVPAVYRRLVRWFKIARVSPEIDRQLEGIGYRVVLTGWIGNVIGWILLGFSLWALIRGLPGVKPMLVSSIMLLTAAVALAVVSGFLSLIPGGLGVRELVLIPLLAHELGLGNLMAVVASIMLRLVWLLSELLVAGLVMAKRKKGFERTERGKY